MKRIHSYLIGALMRGYLLVGASLMALFGLFDFMEQVDDVGEAAFGVGDALLVVVMNLPARLLDLSPFVALLGVVYGLATFVRSHELIAMRAVGLTPLRLAALCGLSTALLFVVLAAVEFGARPLAQQANLLHMTETSQDGALFSQDGIWIQTERLFVRIDSLARGGTPSGIQMYEFDGATLLRFLAAERAEILSPSSWRLHGVMEKHFPRTDRIDDGHVGRIDTRYRAQMPFTPPWNQTTGLYELPLESLSLLEVYSHSRQLTVEKRPAGMYQMEFWRRCLMPLSGVVFSLFAAPFVLGVGPRASMGGAVTLGVAIALGTFLLQQIGTNSLFLWTQSALLAVLVPILALLVAAGALIRRVNGAPRH